MHLTFLKYFSNEFHIFFYFTGKQILLYRRYVCQELMEFLNNDRSPLCNTRPQPMLEPGIQRHLTHFSHITHGFGSPAIVAALGAVQNYVKESTRYLDKIYPALHTGSVDKSASLLFNCERK